MIATVGRVCQCGHTAEDDTFDLTSNECEFIAEE